MLHSPAELIIISGGQSGADRAGLDAAIACGIPHGGWCPRGRWAEDGIIPAKYQLTETNVRAVIVRTRKNVVDSDATLIFTYGPPRGGSHSTVEICRQYRRPWRHVDLREPDDAAVVAAVSAWLSGVMRDKQAALLLPTAVDKVFRLNIAGSRQSSAPGIHARVCRILIAVLRTRAQHEADGGYSEQLAAERLAERQRRKTRSRPARPQKDPSDRTDQSDQSDRTDLLGGGLRHA